MKGQELIRAPLVSEKGTLLTESANQVLFKVRPEANKIEVKKAVEELFKVKVEKVRMARYLGKVRRIGRNLGRRAQPARRLRVELTETLQLVILLLIQEFDAHGRSQVGDAAFRFMLLARVQRRAVVAQAHPSLGTLRGAVDKEYLARLRVAADHVGLAARGLHRGERREFIRTRVQPRLNVSTAIRSTGNTR